MVQPRTDTSKMPIEDASVAWSETLSPFQKVATLEISAQEFDTPERQELGENLSFNPWRCLPEHRPLGGINRARRMVYRTLSSFRHDRNGFSADEPTDWYLSARPPARPAGTCATSRNLIATESKLCLVYALGMGASLLGLGALGAVESNGSVTFGIWLPWVAASNGNALSVKIIHEQDQFLKAVPAREFAMKHETRAPYGDFWSVTVPIASSPPTPGSAWGSNGRYIYRYCLRNPNVGTLDWIVDPFAREFAAGKLSAFTLGYQPYVWSAAEANWKTPPLSDLVVYEVDIAEFGGDVARATQLLAYLQDLGVNAIEVMPLSNVAAVVDWGYLPVGYFGVDERLGKRDDFQEFVDLAHQHGIAVIVDAVYGHSGVDFGYYDVYTRLRYDENPFMGSFAQNYFSSFGKSTDFRRQLTQDYFLSVNNHWLSVYHVDGFRYDCVPNYWDGATGNGYANIVYATHRLTAAQVQAGTPYWTRFDRGAGTPLSLIQCAEQLEGPAEILSSTYSNSTWQNTTFGAAKDFALGNQGKIVDLGFSLGLFGYPSEVSTADGVIPKSAFQYIENHDHERFICNFGLVNPDEAGNYLFNQGDRSRWFKLQPYLIALLLSKGTPMLWQGQEFGENYCLPDNGDGRVSLLRPLRWELFYDAPGTALVNLVRRLLTLRKARPQLRSGEYFYFNDWDRYSSKNLLLFARYQGGIYTLVAVNFSDEDQTVPFWFPIGGDYREELHGGAFSLNGVAALGETQITVPSNYGRVWTGG